jgi:hypothetical protein
MLEELYPEEGIPGSTPNTAKSYNTMPCRILEVLQNGFKLL